LGGSRLKQPASETASLVSPVTSRVCMRVIHLG
jgi:hypothetical protein